MQGTHKSQIQIDVSVWLLLLQQETGTLNNRLLLRAACLSAGAWQGESASVCPLGSQGPCQPCTLLQSCSWTHRFVSILPQLGLELTAQPTRTVQRRDEAGPGSSPSPGGPVVPRLAAALAVCGSDLPSERRPGTAGSFVHLLVCGELDGCITNDSLLVLLLEGAAFLKAHRAESGGSCPRQQKPPFPGSTQQRTGGGLEATPSLCTSASAPGRGQLAALVPQLGEAPWVQEVSSGRAGEDMLQLGHTRRLTRRARLTQKSLSARMASISSALKTKETKAKHPFSDTQTAQKQIL